MALQEEGAGALSCVECNYFANGAVKAPFLAHFSWSRYIVCNAKTV